MKIHELLKYGRNVLSAAGVPDAEADAWLLLSDAVGLDRAGLFLYGTEPAAPEAEERYREMVADRAKRIPLQHITGKACFMGLTFHSDARTLVPRPDTETLVEAVLAEKPSGGSLLDLCTGSGCVLLSYLMEQRRARGIGTDISVKALDTALRNAGELGVLDRVSFVCSDLMDGEAEEVLSAACKEADTVHMILSNPPYIASGEIDGLMEEVRLHDPRIALDGGEDGLTFYRRICSMAPCLLAEGGYLAVEIGSGQGQAVTRLFEKAGFTEIGLKKDLAGSDRVVFGRLPDRSREKNGN